ncbi:Coenzyme F420 hydrogenase/dehydrogenase, beta subunit C-terminal domain [Methylocystis sp. SC2]|uniref:Coenzyme F420 hydrogenase/dehydrogenase, beta subunit C-terminal domain n=1 Tax=Methylocystis sp. (strain SC2) TaxID=187303 RepID=UPI000685F580|nr:Coenzyme F420 hydrogenase/dehydrogenase, beta subunit C-terminal domain [Methylocystis sp. SC2]
MRRSGLCVGCGACAGDGVALTLDRYGELAPRSAARAGANRNVAHICPFSPHAADEDDISTRRFAHAASSHPLIGRFEAAYVGHAAEDGFRAAGSSGGLVSWVAVELLRRGLVDGVAHIAAVQSPPPDGRLFDYRLSRNVEDVRAGAKSRYHPVELSRVIAEIRETPGRYAVVGVPCFIKAIHLLRRRDPLLRARIAFLLGLFCGHMKSARLGESFAWQLGVPPGRMTGIDYRLKNPERPANWYRAHISHLDGAPREEDWWNLVDGDWGAGFFQNSACEFCDDVVAETADISFGDAWLEPYASDGRGVNVVVVRSPLIQSLLERAIKEARVELQEVDADFVVRTQDAGLRHRREGLAYRLALRVKGRRAIQPRKRIAPDRNLPFRRKLVYRARRHIAVWSHRVYLLARRLDALWIYLLWARAAAAAYGALTYGRGPLGTAFDQVERLSRSLGLMRDAGAPSSRAKSRRMEQHDAPEV